MSDCSSVLLGLADINIDLVGVGTDGHPAGSGVDRAAVGQSVPAVSSRVDPIQRVGGDPAQRCKSRPHFPNLL